MRPETKTEQITVYTCGVCNRVHRNVENATGCCVCEICDKAEATIKTTSFGSPDRCAKCHRVKERARLRSAIARAESNEQNLKIGLTEIQARLIALHNEIDSL